MYGPPIGLFWDGLRTKGKIQICGWRKVVLLYKLKSSTVSEHWTELPLCATDNVVSPTLVEKLQWKHRQTNSQFHRAGQNEVWTNFWHGENVISKLTSSNILFVMLFHDSTSRRLASAAAIVSTLCWINLRHKHSFLCTFVSLSPKFCICW